MKALHHFRAFSTSHNAIVMGVLYLAFFLTLLFTPNDINSKVLLAMGILSLLYINKSALQGSLKRHYPLLTLFLWMVISLSYSQDLSMGLDKIQRALILPSAILIFSGLRLSKKQTALVLNLFAGLVALACVYSHITTVIQFFSNGETELSALFNLNYSYLSLGNTLDLHPTYYAFIILSAILVLLHNLCRQTSVSMKIILLLGIAYFSFFIFHLSSRIGIMILYVIIMYQIFRYIFRNKTLKKGLIFLLAFHVFLFALISQIGVTKYRFQHIFGFEYYTGYQVNDGNHKLALWRAAGNANKHFLFGNGIGDVGASLIEQFETSGLKRPAEKKYNSHNQYIEYFVGIGFVGVLLFCYLLYFYFRKFYIEKNIIGVQFVVTLAIFCITECVWNRHHGIVFSVMMLGLLSFLSEEIEAKPLVDRNQ